MIIDAHTHFVPDVFPAVENRTSGTDWPFMQRISEDTSDVIIGGINFRRVLSRCWDVSRRIAEMPDQGIDRQVLSPMPRLLAYELSPMDGLDLSRYLNKFVSQMIASAPDRFYGLGSVPLQDVGIATKELTQIQDMGLNGVEVLTNINGKNLGDTEFKPFLKEAERLGMAIFSHAQHPTFQDRMVGPDPVQNAIGFPIENGLAASAVITSGALEEFPNLRILFSHGGGVLSTILPRLENAWQRQESLQSTLPRSPLEYARMCYFDDVVFDERALRYLMDLIGSEQIVIGSDYPFAFRNQIPEEIFTNLNMSEEQRTDISSKNAMRFLGID